MLVVVPMGADRPSSFDAVQPRMQGLCDECDSNPPRRVSSLNRIYRLSVMDYHCMGETGILGPDLHTELIDGEIVEIPPIAHSHAGTVKFLANRLKEAAGRGVVLAVQDPVWLDDHSEPVPDIALLRPRADLIEGGARVLPTLCS